MKKIKHNVSFLLALGLALSMNSAFAADSCQDMHTLECGLNNVGQGSATVIETPFVVIKDLFSGKPGTAIVNAIKKPIQGTMTIASGGVQLVGGTGSVALDSTKKVIDITTDIAGDVAEEVNDTDDNNNI